jgi:hypothetical protein
MSRIPQKKENETALQLGYSELHLIHFVLLLLTATGIHGTEKMKTII